MILWNYKENPLIFHERDTSLPYARAGHLDVPPVTRSPNYKGEDWEKNTEERNQVGHRVGNWVFLKVKQGKMIQPNLLENLGFPRTQTGSCSAVPWGICACRYRREENEQLGGMEPESLTQTACTSISVGHSRGPSHESRGCHRHAVEQWQHTVLAGGGFWPSRGPKKDSISQTSLNLS